jgi:hypothetical protein
MCPKLAMEWVGFENIEMDWTVILNHFPNNFNLTFISIFEQWMGGYSNSQFKVYKALSLNSTVIKNKPLSKEGEFHWSNAFFPM